jgi:cation transport ATPase
MNEPTKHIALFTASQCLAHDAMLAFLEQRLTKTDQNTVLVHLDACELCKDAMEGLSSIKPQNIQRSVAYLQKTLHQKAQEHQKANKHKESRQLKRNFPWMSVAASIILFLGVFYYFKFYLIKQSDQNKLVSKILCQVLIIPATLIQPRNNCWQWVELKQSPKWLNGKRKPRHNQNFRNP